ERLAKSPRVPAQAAALVFGLAVAALTLAGALLDARRHLEPAHVALALTWLVAATLPASQVALPRYVLPVGVFLNFFFLVAVREVFRRLVGGEGRPAAIAVATAVGLVALHLAFAARHILNLHGPGAPRGTYYATVGERRDAYRWIEANVGRDE